MRCKSLKFVTIASVLTCAITLTTAATAHDNYSYKHGDGDNGEMATQLGPRPILSRR